MGHLLLMPHATQQEDGYYSNLRWNNSRSLFEPSENSSAHCWKTDKVDFESGGSPVAIGIYPVVLSDPVPWLLCCKLEEDATVQYLVLRYEGERIETSLAPKPKVSR